MSYWRFPRYVSVAEKKAKAAEKLLKLQKKRPDIAPIALKGNVLARTWWGKSWNKNLERYADYSNRIGRGKNYVRHGAVLDLKIAPGKVTALVQGTRAKPYEVVITIKAISKVSWGIITKQCQGNLHSLQDLLAGKFSKELGAIFLAEGRGLFPTPQEIVFDCSCPDWASMCKHVAATLYGIGVRLDEDPLLFFTVRQADMKDLVAQAIKEKTGELLAKTSKKSTRVLDDGNLSGLFGIDMETKPDFSASKRKSSDQQEVMGKAAPPSPSGRGAQPESGRKSQQPATALVEDIIRRNKNDTTVAMLEKATGFPRTKIYGITSRLRQQGRVTYVAQGIYGKP